VKSPRRVLRTQEVCGGAPCIDGTRLTCANVVLHLSAVERNLDSYLKVFPFLAAADVVECVDYCAEQKCLVDDRVKYCQRCTLDRSQPLDPPQGYVGTIEEIRDNANVAQSGQLFLGSPSEYLEDVTPVDVWKIAGQLLPWLRAQSSS
jgi:uncharacterized protein (DUF433 family)